jgi:HK97 family phage portal protein
MASFLQWTKQLWDRINPPLSDEQRAVYAFDVYGESDIGTRTASGARVSEESGFKYSVAYAAMTLIADGIAGLKPEALRELEDGSEEKATVPNWIIRPHPELRRFDVWNQLLLSVLAWGNGYAMLIRRPTDGQIIGLEVIDPGVMTVEWDPAMPFKRRYKINNQGPWLSSMEIFHIQGPTLPGQAAGLSVIAQAREAIGLGLTLEEFGGRYFGQGSQAKVVLEVPQQMDTAEAARMVKTYERFHKGKANWHRPAIMSGGTKLHNISIPPNDAQFLESRQFQAVDVARWFRVPPHRVGIIGVQTSWGSGLAEENLAMLQHTYRPWINRVEETLSWYTPTLSVNIHLNTESLLRPTFKENAEVMSKLYLSELVMKNEARQRLGLPKVPDGDKFWEPPMNSFSQPGTAPSAPSTGAGSGGSAPVDKEKDRKRKQDEAKQ